MSAFTIPADQQHYIAGNVASSTDRDGRPQVDPSGAPVWDVRVVSLPDAEPGSDRVPMPEVTRVAVPARTQPQLHFGERVTFDGLTVRTWSARDGRAGLRYSADAIRTGAATTVQPQPPEKRPAQTAQNTETGR